MPQKQKWYDLPAATALRNYAESNFRMLAADKKVYKALQSLESQQDGLCKDVVANHRTIARVAKVNRKTVQASLLRQAEAGLIRYTPGSTDYAKRKASRICRFPLDDLKAIQLMEQPAHKLAAIMNKRQINYGGKMVQPTYKVATTNRLYTSKPNVQGHKDVRGERLAAGCKEGEILIELDFKAAEPSVIAQTLGYEMDGYSIIAEAEGWHVDDVKGMFNAIVYTRSRSTITTAKKHGSTAPKALEFFAKVDELREQLRRPEGKPVRKTTTVTGTTIEARTGKKVHNGTLLSYYAQGTIADYINKGGLEIVALEKKRGWKLVTTCHDAAYVIARPEQEDELRALILKQVGKELKLELKVKWEPVQQPPNPREAQKTGTQPHIPIAT